MSQPPVDAEARYATIVDALVGSPNVTLGPSSGAKSTRGFGSSALRINDKIFAMLSSSGEFVVKLPRQRVDALIASGDGERFDPGHGRLMKEWLAMGPTSEEEWLPLAKEAMEFVGSRR